MRWLAALLALLAGCGEDPAEETIRIATFNVHLARGEAGALIAEFERGSPQIDAVTQVVATVNPDIILINELDYDAEEKALSLFQMRLSEAGADYAYRFSAPVNTGVPTGLDLTGDGKDYGPEDAQGWGVFPGQFGMAILSRFPIIRDDAKTFQNILWANVPGTLYPAEYFPDAAKARLRMSSKSHWDVPLRIGDRVIHLLASHPTPPVFDGDEDRNGRRNADEIRFWINYIDGDAWIESDQGKRGGLTSGTAFVVLGDLNADPERGDGKRDVIRALLNHPKVNDTRPMAGGSTATADWKQTGPLRVDYVLPSSNLSVAASGVFAGNDKTTPEITKAASDHRLVWVDVRAGAEFDD